MITNRRVRIPVEACELRRQMFNDFRQHSRGRDQKGLFDVGQTEYSIHERNATMQRRGWSGNPR